MRKRTSNNLERQLAQAEKNLQNSKINAVIWTIMFFLILFGIWGALFSDDATSSEVRKSFVLMFFSFFIFLIGIIVINSRGSPDEVDRLKSMIRGDHIDLVKDSILNRSSTNDSKIRDLKELKELKEMFDSGFISKNDMEKMKKEIMER